MVCSNLKVGMGHNFPFLGKDHGYFGYFVKTGPKLTFDFNTLSERPFSRLSKNHKIYMIGPTELKLWPFKDASLTLVTSVPLCSYTGLPLNNC